jgi:transcriptional regulator with XRE-family HTH domain
MKKKNYLSKEYKLKIGGNIRKWRNLKGMKQKELALSLELSEAAISNIENNITDITLSQLEDISLGLDISVEQLFTDPQLTAITAPNSSPSNENPHPPPFENELMKAVITSIQKKDEQIQIIMQNVLHTMTAMANRDSAVGNRQ